MSRILSVEGYNFVTYKHFFLNLEDEKSIFIGGDNKDTPSMGGNGVGKSLLFDAIMWCLYDRTVRESSGKDKIIGPFDKFAYVREKWLDDDGRVIDIQRYRKHPKFKNNAVIYIDGVHSSKVTTIKKLGTNAQIVKLLGIDGTAFLHSVVFSKGRGSICDEKEAKRRKLLSHILNLDRFDKAQKAARSDKRNLEKVLNALNTRCASIETEVVELKGRISDAKLALEEEGDRISKQKKVISRNKKMAKGELRQLKRERTELKGRVETLRERSSKNRSISSDIDKLHRKLGAQRGIIRNIDSEYKQTVRYQRKAQHSIEHSRCHECGQKLRSQVGKFKAKIDRCESEKKQLARKRRLAVVEADDLVAQAKKLSKKLDLHVDNKLSKASARLRYVVRDIKKWRSVDEELYDSTPKLKKRLAVLRKRYKKAKKEHKKTIGKIEKVTEKIRIADFWIAGFGPKGVKKFIINGVLDYLEKKANEYLEEMTDGYIKVKWESERELKSSGEKRDVLMLNVTTGARGDKEYHVCSLGEQARVWLSMELALNTLIRSSIDLALVDEAFDGLAPVGVTRAIKMLSDEGSRRKIITVSHKPGIDKFFAKKAVVVLENDTSSLQAA